MWAIIFPAASLFPILKRESFPVIQWRTLIYQWEAKWDTARYSKLLQLKTTIVLRIKTLHEARERFSFSHPYLIHCLGYKTMALNTLCKVLSHVESRAKPAFSSNVIERLCITYSWSREGDKCHCLGDRHIRNISTGLWTSGDCYLSNPDLFPFLLPIESYCIGWSTVGS